MSSADGQNGGQFSQEVGEVGSLLVVAVVMEAFDGASLIVRLCITSMGGTPVDRSRIQAHDEEPEDPADEFLN